MNDKPPNQGEGQPSHQAAKVVIPFDIDMSEVESKLAEIERRFSNIAKPESAQDIRETKSAIEADQRQALPEVKSAIEAGPQQAFVETKAIASQSKFDYGADEKPQTEMLATLNRMADLVRQLNDTVLLIYSNLSNRN